MEKKNQKQIGRPVGNPFDKVRKEGWKNQDIEYKKGNKFAGKE